MGRSTLPLHTLQLQAHSQRKAQAQAAPQPATPTAPPTNTPARIQPRAQATGTGAVRIIGGQWKRRKLPIAASSADNSLRPTPDRVRETLFNWLGQNLAGWHCVDVCAGTGALGFEAASRGAAAVHMFDSHPALAAQLHRNKTLLQAAAVQIQAGDGVAAMHHLAKQQPGSMDAIFLDPPFAADWYTQALHAAKLLLKPQGFCYLEARRRWADDELAAAGWHCLRHLKAGAVHAHLLQLLPQATPI